MAERTGIVTFKGSPLTLIGKERRAGDAAPDVEVIDNDMSPVKLSRFKDQVCIISAVPSLDTPVCDIETRKFNARVEGLGPKLMVLTISMDLPFAQKRWCASSGVRNVKTLSDYRGAAFGKAYGVLIKELHLLARSIFVVDTDRVIQYTQIVPEVTDEPDYDKAIDAAKRIL